VRQDSEGLSFAVIPKALLPNLPIRAETPTAAELSRSEERAILWVTCLASFLFFNSFGSIGMALPAIQSEFGNSLSEL